MRALSPFELLRIWERGVARHPADRAMVVLAAALPEHDRNALAALPLGQRDRMLAALRINTFGPVAVGWDECARCGEQVEFGVPVEALAGAPCPESSIVDVALPGGSVQVRLPNSADLLEIADLDERVAARELATRCVVSRDGGDGDQPFDEVELQLISEALEGLDPYAVTTLRIQCGACADEWERDLEIGAFFWDEIAAAARRLLYEVATLASAWGWSERDILSMSPRRRQTYLAMVTG